MAISTGAAILGGSLISGGLGVAGAQRGGKEQGKGLTASLAEQRRQFDLARSDLGPWRDIGQGALNMLGKALGIEGYRTDEEIAYTAFLKTKPTEPTGKYSTKDFQSETSQLLTKHPGYRESDGKAIAGPEYMFSVAGSGFGGITDALFRGAGKNKKKAARAALIANAAQEKKYQKALADWNNEAARLKGISEQSLSGYDSGAAARSMLEASPDYQFRLSQGERALNRSIAATTGVLQPGASKELLKYGQEFGSTEWSNYINRLLATAGLGQTASQGQANLAAQAGTQNANLLAAIGSVKAGAINNAYGAANNAVQGGIQNYLTMSMYDKLLTR